LGDEVHEGDSGLACRSQMIHPVMLRQIWRFM